jgi:2-polyprenyl-3-methyl-5-hydroxy-6-metoxy-1,4-benzoquinol methylase
MVRIMVVAPFETPDIESSTDDYATRFAGEIGSWFLSVQLRATLEPIADLKQARIIDVGGGHGQLLGGLLDAGHQVTVTGSHENCTSRIRPLLENARATFKVCPLTKLDFESESFDVAVSYRMMSHLEDWKTLVKELCRVSANKVLVDYPTYRSVNLLNCLMFKLKHGLEKNTRDFKIFREKDVIREFEKNGFHLARRYGQYVLPMAFHRAHQNRKFAEFIEGGLRIIGLAWLFGSPVIACFEKVKS